MRKGGGEGREDKGGKVGRSEGREGGVRAGAYPGGGGAKGALPPPPPKLTPAGLN